MTVGGNIASTAPAIVDLVKMAQVAVVLKAIFLNGGKKSKKNGNDDHE